MSNANGLSPFRGKVDQFIIPVGYFKGNYPVASKHQKIVVEEPSPKYVLTKIDQVQRTTPQEENAEVFYSKGLEISPYHIRINQYMGELYVTTNRIDQAKERLAVLDGCECKEYTLLKDIIDGKTKSKY